MDRDVDALTKDTYRGADAEGAACLADDEGLVFLTEGFARVYQLTDHDLVLLSADASMFEDYRRAAPREMVQPWFQKITTGSFGIGGVDRVAGHCLVGVLGGHVIGSSFVMCTGPFHEAVGHSTIESLARNAFAGADLEESARTMFEASRAVVEAREPRPAGRNIFSYDRGAAIALIRGREEC